MKNCDRLAKSEVFLSARSQSKPASRPCTSSRSRTTTTALFPGGIFNKGFVKSYAKYVGIDEQEALQDYAAIIAGDEEQADNSQKVYRPEVLTDDRTSSSMIPTVIFAVIILGLMTWGILALVNYIQNSPSQPAAANTDTNTNSNSNTGTVQAPAQQMPRPWVR